MGKQLYFKAGLIQSTLVVFGWLAFFGAFMASSPIWVVVLQSVARVLPKVLSVSRTHNGSLQLTAQLAGASWVPSVRYAHSGVS